MSGLTGKSTTVRWAVSSRSYSDYRVLCICDSKKRAERIAGLYNADRENYGDAMVETIPYFAREPVQVTSYERQANVWDDGTVSDQRDSQNTEWEFSMFWPERNTPVGWRWVRAPIHDGKGGRLEVYGTDRKRVLRVFSDRKAQLLVEDAFRMRGEVRG